MTLNAIIVEQFSTNLKKNGCSVGQKNWEFQCKQTKLPWPYRNNWVQYENCLVYSNVPVAPQFVSRHRNVLDATVQWHDWRSLRL